MKHAGITLAAALIAALALVGCNSNVTAASSSSVEGLTGGVAATVNGNEIMEDEVTTLIQSWRSANGLSDQDTWGNYLVSINDDPVMFREEIIDLFISQKLVAQACEERGIEVTDEELDESVANMRANYESDEAWEEALAQAGTTEEEYRENVKNSMLEQRLQDAIAEEADTTVTEEDMLEAAQMYATYIDGSRRSSHILFSLDDEETAKQVLEQLKNGEIEFEDAVSEYSIDTASAAEGGDVGWDMINSFVTEYSEGLSALDAGEMSDLVESQYGYHIIKCTEIYTAPEDGVTSLDQVPDDLVEIITSELESGAQTTAISEWYSEYKEAADIVINDMPEGLPYDVDMSLYQTDEDEDADESGLEVEVDSSEEGIELEDEAEAEADSEATSEDAAATTDEQPAEISSEAEARSSEAA